MTYEPPGGGRVPTFQLVQRGKKKTYHASWYQGEHRYKTLETSNLKEARRRLDRLAARIEQGEAMTAPRLTVDEAVEKFLQFHRTKGSRRKTVGKYKDVMEDFSGFLGDQHVTQLRGVRPTHMDDYRAARKDRWEDYSLYNHCIIIKGFTKWLAARELIQNDPFMRYALEKPERTKYPSPSQEELQAILPLILSHYFLPTHVLACTAMRSGELCRLRVEDVDLKGNWFHIVSRPGAETKSGRNRKIPIHPSLHPGLTAHRPCSEWFFSLPPSREYPEGGRQLISKRLNECFTRRVGYAGLVAGRPNKGFVIHSLRGFFKSFAINHGVPQAVVDTWLDHSQRGMNAFYYQLNDADSQRWMAQIPFALVQ